MDPTAPQPPQQFKFKPTRSRKRTIATVLIIVASFLVVMGVVVAGLYVWHHQGLVNEVKTSLKQIPPSMEAARKGGNGYPTTLSEKQLPKDSKVTFSGTGSFDGTAYCVTGTSKEDTSIVYHISSTNKEPQPGSCADATDLSAPSAPGDLAIGAIGIDQISATWSAATFASSYTLQCATDTNFKDSVVSKTVQTTSGMCDNLKSSTAYSVRVRANNTSKPSAWSNVITVTTDIMSVAPAAPKGSNVTRNSVTFTWNPVSGATSYVVEKADDINFMKNVVRRTVPASQTSAIFDGLQPNTTYLFHVKAVTANFDATQAAFGSETQVRTLK